LKEKEALLLEKDKDLVSLRELMAERVKELESKLAEKEEQMSENEKEIYTLRQAEERTRALFEAKVKDLESGLLEKERQIREKDNEISSLREAAEKNRELEAKWQRGVLLFCELRKTNFFR